MSSKGAYGDMVRSSWAMRQPLVATSLENDIGTVTLNHSKKHNALSAALIADLLEAGQKLNASGVKVVILRAAPDVKVWSTMSTSCQPTVVIH